MEFFLIYSLVVMTVICGMIMVIECIYQVISNNPTYYASKKGKKILEILESIF